MGAFQFFAGEASIIEKNDAEFVVYAGQFRHFIPPAGCIV